MSVYQPLQQYLSSQQDASVVMSYDQIERVLGRRLPPTARGNAKRQWWANTETHSQALAWLRANRRAKIDVDREEVTFVRTEQEKNLDADMRVGLRLMGLTSAAHRMLQDVAEEKGVTLEAAAVQVLNDMARRRRAMTLDWFAGKSKFSDVSSTDLIREDRDAR